MLSRPRFRNCFEVVPISPRLLLLLEEQRQIILEGAIYVRLAPLLDGGRTLSEIASALSPGTSLPEIFGGLSQLERRGCLVEGDSEPLGASEAYLEALPGTHVLYGRRHRVAVRSVGAAVKSNIEGTLIDSGFEISEVNESGEPGDFLIVETDDYLQPGLEAINEESLRLGRPWMLVKPIGFTPWIGPIFVPGSSGCWSCLAQRLRSNRQMERYVRDHSSIEGPIVTSLASLPATIGAAESLAVAEVERFLKVSREGSLEGRLLSMDLLGLVTQEHVLVRRPQCRSCGEEEHRPGRAPEPVVLTSHAKRYWADGGHRVRRPEETFERFKHHVSPLLGAVTDLRPALGRYHPELTPAYVAGHNFSMGVESVVFLRESLRCMSGGKGSTPIQAKVSGLAEAIERYSGMWTGEEYAVRGSLESLGPDAVHPNACMGFSEAQYQGRDAWNASQAQPISRCVLVPRPFDPSAELDWSPAWSLTNLEQKLFPSAYCYYGHPEFAARWSIPDSNGCAAGNTLEEAILQGFMELVERDAVALWWYSRIPRRGVDLASFDVPYLRAIQRYYASIGRSLRVLDITSDLGIPTLACVSARTSGPTEDILVGFGAHFDPKVALLRAITEVNQFLPSISQTRPDGSTIYLFGDELARHWWKTSRMADLDYLVPDPGRPDITAGEFEDPSSDDLAEDVRHCVETARRIGLEVLVLDMTRPDLGLNVVRVIVPGLCHFWRRFGFKRLREVPVAQGWLDRPLEVDQLNPYTIFF